MTEGADLPAGSIGADFVASQRSEATSIEIDGEAVIYNASMEMTHILNPTAAIVWGLIDGRTEIGDIAAELAEAFSAPEDRVLSDVLELVREFGRKGLLENVSADTPAKATDPLGT